MYVCIKLAGISGCHHIHDGSSSDVDTASTVGGAHGQCTPSRLGYDYSISYIASRFCAGRFIF